MPNLIEEEMNALKLLDLKNWLTDNKIEYERLRAEQYPPLGNEVYWMYIHLSEFVSYYKYTHKCHEALQKLKPFLNRNFSKIIKWTQTYKQLGSQQLLMFDVNYLNWNENVNEELLKIHEGLYTDRQPFADIICFCKIFQLLYWNNAIHERDLSDEDQLVIANDLQNIFDKYYVGKVHQ